MNLEGSLMRTTPKEPSYRFLWSHNLVAKAAAKYNTRREFKESCAGGYGYACRNGILDLVCSHMLPPKRPIKWSKDTLIERAKNYDNPYEFRKYEPAAYRASKKIGCYGELIGHMKSKGSKHIKPYKPLKKLPAFKRDELKYLNKARSHIGLKPLRIKIRKCISCGTNFESIEARTCGCLTATGPVTRFDPLVS